MRQAGAPVAAPILIDAYYDQRFWPTGAWLRGQWRRSRAQLARIRRMPPAAALREFGFRTRRLAGRLMSRWRRAAPAPRPGAQETASATSMAAHIAALRAWDPGFHPGRLVLLSAADPVLFGCRPEELWRSRCGAFEAEAIAGNHLELVRDPASLARLAAAVDRHLATSSAAARPLALLVASFRWPATAGVAQALDAAGFGIAAVCPRRHPMRPLPGLIFRPIPWRRPEAALRDVVARLDPELILPCDEPALALVQALPPGRQGRWPRLSRSEVIDLARGAGVRAPATARIESLEALETWIAEHGLPLVLKTDGSWGGRGLAIGRDRVQAMRLWRQLSRGPGLVRALKRLVVNGAPQTLRDSGAAPRRRCMRRTSSPDATPISRLRCATARCWRR